MITDGMASASSQLAPQLLQRLRAGDPRALARAISLVESDATQAQELLTACFPFTGRSLRVGLTGPPGAGKSTLIDRLGRHYRESGKTVGVIAVDPTSPYSGGAILGDRIRMQGFSGDPGFYARSMATRGALGGLARTTNDVATIVEASGKEIILIETVGVGQDEVDIARLADVTVVVLVPGMGDDVQSIKAGILEIADLFVINKSDRDGAEQLEAEIRASQSLGHSTKELGWTPPVLRVVATCGDGVEQLLASIEGFAAWLASDGRLERRRAAQWKERIVEMMRSELLRKIWHSKLGEEKLNEMALQVVRGEENPYILVPNLMTNP